MTLAKGLASILVFALLFAGCSDDSGKSGGGSADHQGTAVQVPRPQVPPLLKYRFEQGRKSHCLHSTMIDVQTGMGPMTLGMVFDIGKEVVELTPEGAAKFTYTYDRVRMKSQNPMMGVAAEYDSESEDAERQAQNQAVIGGVALTGSILTLTQHPDGSITDLSGMDEVVKKMQDLVVDDPTGAMSMGMLNGMFSNEAWEILLELPGVVFPDESLKKGATWTQDSPVTLPMLGTLGMTTTYTFVGSEQKDKTTIATITSVAKLDPESLKTPEPDPADPIAAMLSQLKVSSGDLTGTATFDMEAGRLIKSESTLKLTMELMGMPMENTTQFKLEFVK